MRATLGGLEALGQPAGLGGLRNRAEAAIVTKKMTPSALRAPKMPRLGMSSEASTGDSTAGPAVEAARVMPEARPFLSMNHFLAGGERRVVAQAVADSGDEREPQVELPRLGDGAGHEPAQAVAHGGSDHDVARADLIGDAAGEDARHGHDGLEDGESQVRALDHSG